MAALVNQSSFCHLPIEQLQRGRFQPRRDFDETALRELAGSIRCSGLIQPIVVRPCGKQQYEIVAGERRWRAAQLAGLDVVPCLIHNYTDEQTAAVTTIENIQRLDLNPIEEAQALQRLIDDFHYSHEEVAAVIGKPRSQVSNSLRLLRLDERIQRWLIEGRLSEGHGKILAGLNHREQMTLAQKCVDQGWSVRQAEQFSKKMQTKPADSLTSRADIKRLERVIADQLGAKVKVDVDTSTSVGWLSIQFYDNDTLAGLLEKMGIQDD